MNKLQKSVNPLTRHYRRTIITDEIIHQLSIHSRIGTQALAKQLGISQAAVIKYRRLKNAS